MYFDANANYILTFFHFILGKKANYIISPHFHMVELTVYFSVVGFAAARQKPTSLQGWCTRAYCSVSVNDSAQKASKNT